MKLSLKKGGEKGVRNFKLIFTGGKRSREMPKIKTKTADYFRRKEKSPSAGPRKTLPAGQARKKRKKGKKKKPPSAGEEGGGKEKGPGMAHGGQII